MEDFVSDTPSSRAIHDGINLRYEEYYINKHGSFAIKQTTELDNKYFDYVNERNTSEIHQGQPM